MFLLWPHWKSRLHMMYLHCHLTLKSSWPPGEQFHLKGWELNPEDCTIFSKLVWVFKGCKHKEKTETHSEGICCNSCQWGAGWGSVAFSHLPPYFLPWPSLSWRFICLDALLRSYFGLWASHCQSLSAPWSLPSVLLFYLCYLVLSS